MSNNFNNTTHKVNRIAIHSVHYVFNENLMKNYLLSKLNKWYTNDKEELGLSLTVLYR